MGTDQGEGVECAECESERAQVVCCTESLAYCNPCSHKIHSKKARSHHTILPIPPCSHCLIRPATVQCSQCSSRPKPAVLCTRCSTSIHLASSSARAHSIAIITILNNIIKDELHVLMKVKQEKTDCESGCSAQEGKKRKRNGGCDSETKNKYPHGKRPRLNFKEEPLVVPKEEMPSLPRRNTPRAATRRVFGPVEIHDSSSESEADKGSDSCFSDFEEETGIRRIHRGNVSVEAFVVNAEDDDEELEGGGGNAGSGKEESVVVGIKEKIRKMLELGLHPETPDTEAQQALKNAQRLLTKHNLQQAEVMKGALKDSEALAGGMRIVELRSKGRIQRIGRIEQWVIDLAHVIADNFDTQYFTRKYTRKDRPLQVIFYGIKQNADCAGYAFAATFNRITVMSSNYTPNSLGDKENEEPTAQSTYTRIARNNYKMGIVAGLQDAVRKSSEKWHSQDGDETASGRKGKSNRRIKDTKTEAMQALILHSKEVGEAYIKGRGIKIRTFKARLRDNALNFEAFTQGKTDSKKIDINQKALPTTHTEKSSKKP